MSKIRNLTERQQVVYDNKGAPHGLGPAEEISIAGYAADNARNKALVKAGIIAEGKADEESSRKGRASGTVES